MGMEVKELRMSMGFELISSDLKDEDYFRDFKGIMDNEISFYRNDLQGKEVGDCGYEMKYGYEFELGKVYLVRRGIGESVAVFPLYVSLADDEIFVFVELSNGGCYGGLEFNGFDKNEFRDVVMVWFWDKFEDNGIEIECLGSIGDYYRKEDGFNGEKRSLLKDLKDGDKFKFAEVNRAVGTNVSGLNINDIYVVRDDGDKRYVINVGSLMMHRLASNSEVLLV